MIKYSQNRFVDSFLKMLLVLAIIHTLTIVFYFLSVRNVQTVNLFHLIGLDMIFPGITGGAVSNVFSLVLFLSLYFIIYLFFSKRTKD